MAKSDMIYRSVLERLLEGGFSAGAGRLPGEEALAAEYGSSRPTVRKALERLKHDGLITIIRGSGAYVVQEGGSAADRSPEGEDCEARGASPPPNLFGVIFPNLGPGYLFDPLCKRLAHYAAKRGDSVVWSGYVSPESDTLSLDVTQICERYIARNISGLFFAPFEYHHKGDILNTEIVSVIAGAGIPIVLIDANTRAYPAPNEFDLVSMDHTQASYILTEHIINRGFSRIFFIAPPDSHHTIKLRLIGYHEAMLDRGLVPAGLVELASGDETAVAALLEAKKPDALVCSNDFVAMKLINTLEKLGRSVPGDIAVAGFDHLSAVMPFSRSITSVEQPVNDISRAALELMLARIADPSRPVRRITFPGRLFP